MDISEFSNCNFVAPYQFTCFRAFRGEGVHPMSLFRSNHRVLGREERIRMPVEKTRNAFVTPDGEGQTIHVIGDDVTIKISSRDTGGAFAVFDSRTLPQHGPPLHMHREQDETWFIVDGDYRFEVDGREIIASAGDTVFAARGTWHTFQNIGDHPGHLLTTVVPGGLDLFFEELEMVVPEGTQPDPMKMMPLFEKYALELLGPPLAERDRTPVQAVN